VKYLRYGGKIHLILQHRLLLILQHSYWLGIFLIYKNYYDLQIASIFALFCV